MRLSSLLEALDLPRIHADPEIHAVTRDSRRAGPGVAFVAIVGTRTDGHTYVGSCNASVAFVEHPVSGPIPQIVVPNTKAVLAAIAACLEGRPADTVRTVGVTGTNGKTSITTMVSQAMQRMGLTTGRIGTTGNEIAGQVIETAFTTPEAPELQRLLAQMRDAEVDAALLEVSSHGLEQRRVDGIRFHTAVFTNLTRDHLDFHGTMEAYAQAKAMLFQRLRPAGGAPRALLFGDDPAWTLMQAPVDHWTYGLDGDLRLHPPTLTDRGMRFDVDTPLGPVELHTSLLGHHNALNLVASLGIGLTLGLDPEAFAGALSEIAGAPGRLERVPGELLVLVDYAHSPDALETVLPTVGALRTGKTWVVFGAGGDRDASKRPLMGAAAERHADWVVLTSDNPRSEDPEDILDDIAAGMSSTPVRLQDRAEAIRYAILNAEPSDVVLIAGKGHETTQEVGGAKRPFDDRVVAAAALKERA